jgi:hypothetical protein
MKTVNRRALLSFLIALMLLSGASRGLWGSGQTWRPPRPVAMTIRGGADDTVLELFSAMPSGKTWATFAGESGGEQLVGGLLLRDGDLVGISDECWFVYKQSDGASLDLRGEDGRLIQSGKTISILLEGSEDTEDSWEWLDQASAKDLRSLRLLMLPGKMDESRLPTLRKVAAVNPDLGLDIESLSSSMSSYMSAVALFKPRVLILKRSAPAAELSGILADQNQIETLILNVRNAKNLDFLAAFPNLRRLAISDWDPAETGPLPKGMRALKSLLLYDSELLEASALAAVPEGIQELSLVSCKKIASLSGLERFSNLRTIILNLSSEIGDLSALKGMKKLAWVGLPPGITQEQFSAFVGEHPALKIVEFVSCNGITDLTPLQHLTGLTGLVVAQYSGDQSSGKFTAMDQMDRRKSLEFLGLPAEAFDKDPDQVARIRTELPRALVVPAVPYCLGSGWILLVIPLAALMWIAGAWARGRRRTQPQGADR